MKYRLVPGLTPAWATVILMVCEPTFLARNENRKITMPTINLNIAPPPFRAQPRCNIYRQLAAKISSLASFVRYRYAGAETPAAHAIRCRSPRIRRDL